MQTSLPVDAVERALAVISVFSGVSVASLRCLAANDLPALADAVERVVAGNPAPPKRGLERIFRRTK